MNTPSRSIEVALCIVATVGATASLIYMTEREVCPTPPAVVQPQVVTPIIRVEAQTPEVMPGAFRTSDTRAMRRTARAELRAMRNEMRTLHRPKARAVQAGCGSSAELASGETTLQQASLPVRSDADGSAVHVPPENIEYTTIKRSTLQDLMRADEPFGQALAIPSYRDGKFGGIKVYKIREGSILRTLGFKNGDALVSVNGHTLNGLESAMASYQKLSASEPRVVRVDILRRGTPMAKIIEIR